MIHSLKPLSAGCLLAISAVATTTAVEPDPSTRQQIEAVEQGLLPSVRIKGRTKPLTISSRMEHYQVPAISIAVIDGHRIVWARGYGVTDVDDPHPVDEHTLFQAASISKPVSALAALKLVEDGAITLDGNVNQWLKSWELPENDFTKQHPVTLETLLSHTAGTTVHGFGGYRPGTELPTLPQILNGEPPANSSAVRVDKMPGKGFRYSGGGTTIVQQLVEDVSGRPYAEFLQTEVLTPLGMLESSYEQPLPANRHTQAARGHNPRGRRVKGGWQVYPERAAAGLWTTPTDLARYAIEVQLAYHDKSHKVLARDTVRDMLTPRGPYGLGPRVSVGDEATRFSHGGSNEGFKCQLFADLKRGQGAAVMTNGDQGAALAREVLNAIAAVYDWPDFLSPEHEIADVDEAVLKRYVGRYVLKRFGTVVVKAEDGYLSARSLFGPNFQLLFESETEFFTNLNALSGKFATSDDGRIELIVRFRDEQLRGKQR